jgi:UPF0716 protein FxsA
MLAMWVFALALGLPLIEISLFVTVGAWLGLWITLAIVVGTAVLGVWLIRRQGQKTQSTLKAAFGAESRPTQGLAGDVLVVVAGALLVLPGFFTDVCGLLLLLPPVQRKLLTLAARRVAGKTNRHTDRGTAAAGSARFRADDIIDTVWEELPDDSAPPPPRTRH